MTYGRKILSVALPALLAGACAAAERAESRILFDFGAGFDVRSVETKDAKAAAMQAGTLRVEAGHTAPWPSVALKAPRGRWDLSSYEYIALEVVNRGKEKATIHCRVDNPGADGTNRCVTDQVAVDPGASQTLTVRIFPVPWKLDRPLELVGMRGAPIYAGKIDTADVTQLLLFWDHPKTDCVFEVGNIRAGGRVETLDALTFLPFIDELGEYSHKDWPGKTHTAEEIAARGRAEEEDLKAHAKPKNWNKYGGWADGPKLKATGFFRVQKHKGKWWLVDPTGKLFWSHGLDCIRSVNATPITDRERYFRNLPGKDSPFARFYGEAARAPLGYYKDHAPYRTYDFTSANLLRKYGEDFEQIFADVTHRRLASWAVNTIANWSDEKIYLLRWTPYAATISFDARKLEGSQGYWGKFYDVFDPSFETNLRRRLEREKGQTAGDPWCLGYFVHNELAWGDDTSLALATLVSPADQPAKIIFVEDLKARYETIEELNQAWGTNHTSWEALLQSQKTPDQVKARPDLEEFYTKIAETYFSTIRRELKRAAPEQLYLGCRFAWVNDRAARAATKFCDVVSYNRYTYSVQDTKLPDGIDMPVIIGEFHFGALDRGLFHTGLRRAENQKDRAEKYTAYVRGALRNPYIVGTHWFQYLDQPTTGRGDGENYQIGFVDICDKPYPEIVQAAREVGNSMYEYRFED
ncbi:MAG: beta-galactosidase [Planctomycetes bacterium]|nr:beta-galactosidase [Planctomycetota bacterium]